MEAARSLIDAKKIGPSELGLYIIKVVQDRQDHRKKLR
jgi:hypothetical protein